MFFFSDMNKYIGAEKRFLHRFSAVRPLPDLLYQGEIMLYILFGKERGNLLLVAGFGVYGVPGFYIWNHIKNFYPSWLTSIRVKPRRDTMGFTKGHKGT